MNKHVALGLLYRVLAAAERKESAQEFLMYNHVDIEHIFKDNLAYVDRPDGNGGFCVKCGKQHDRPCTQPDIGRVSMSEFLASARSDRQHRKIRAGAPPPGLQHCH